jgi:hypothetical protein
VETVNDLREDLIKRTEFVKKQYSNIT